MTEQEIKRQVGGFSPLSRELYREHLEMAKERRGLPLTARSIEAANDAMQRTLHNIRVRREKQWPYTSND